MERQWTTADAAALYGVDKWANGLFSVSETGEVVVQLHSGAHDAACSLYGIVQGLRERGVELPVLLRFENILDARVESLNRSFEKAMAEAEYRGNYRGLYPVKVNQQQQVVEEITSFGRRYHHGLETGSKAELAAALAYMRDPEAYIVCNGYKDEEFMDLALFATKMGLQTVLVLETPGELPVILERAERIGVRPCIGLRARLAARGSGRWIESGGDRSVFGLNTAQIMDVVETLRARDRLDCLRMLHYHIGSQITNIRTIRAGITEAMRVYVNLVREGAGMGLLNVGGGLAVDYDGSHTDSISSSNYGMDEYCADLIEAVMAVCDEAGVPHPTIMSESGRALVAYSSVLLFNILDVCRMASHGMPPALPEGAPELLERLVEVDRVLTRRNAQECYHDAVYYRDEIRALFLHGDLGLRERALGEQIFWHLMGRLASLIENANDAPVELQGLDTAMADIYYGNFSVFQSLPDAWAIEQLFPVMPVHRLHEEPTRNAILADVTCDCDGKLDRFIGGEGGRRTLPLHPVRDGEPYVLGVFLVGAYQETLGDLHNLFGDTNVVGVRIGEDGEVEYSREIVGDSVSDVLSYVEYDPKTLTARFRGLAEAAVRAQRITPAERRGIMEAYESGLRGYTYFEG
ncbi:MAG: biosynthetic arginine decarboxylase [Lentisphaerae bacterium]|nr:biosynthetic arginine decarboxylase [Lentisphaerota bacterium]